MRRMTTLQGVPAATLRMLHVTTLLAPFVMIPPVAPAMTLPPARAKNALVKRSMHASVPYVTEFLAAHPADVPEVQMLLVPAPRRMAVPAEDSTAVPACRTVRVRAPHPIVRPACSQVTHPATCPTHPLAPFVFVPIERLSKVFFVDL